MIKVWGMFVSCLEVGLGYGQVRQRRGALSTQESIARPMREGLTEARWGWLRRGGLGDFHCALIYRYMGPWAETDKWSALQHTYVTWE